MTKHLVIACVAVSFAAGAAAQTPTRTRVLATGRLRMPSTLRLLNQRIPEVAFDSVPFEQVMEWVAELTGANVVVRWEALEQYGVERDKPITMKVRNLRLSQVLWMIMNEAGGSDTKLAYRASGSLLILSTEEDLSKEMVVKVYDVGDLLLSPPQFTNAAQLDPAQALGQAGRGGTGGGSGGSQLFQTQNQDRDEGNRDVEADIQTLVDLITSTVEPTSWQVNGGSGQIFPFRNLLVVSNSLIVHQRLGGYVREEVVGP